MNIYTFAAANVLRMTIARKERADRSPRDTRKIDSDFDRCDKRHDERPVAGL